MLFDFLLLLLMLIAIMTSTQALDMQGNGCAGNFAQDMAHGIGVKDSAVCTKAGAARK